MAAFVTFWGTRGSIPTPGNSTRVYGGNTLCIEVRFDDTLFICDAGSGIRGLGNDLLTRERHPDELHLLITHAHWDHIQGFPFFAPAYIADTNIRVYGASSGDHSRHRLLSGQMTSAYFPVGFGELRAEIIDDHLDDGAKDINGVHVTCFPLNHPGGAFGYTLEKDGTKIVYLTDNEIVHVNGEALPDPRQETKPRSAPAKLVDAVRNADLLIADAQYTDEEYASKVGWGHSSCLTVADLAIQAGVTKLALFHHDPATSDLSVDERVKSCVDRATQFKSDLFTFGAREGVTLKF
jgi:phosphoribosyl 1,2-cyclic phosphodiesterase